MAAATRFAAAARCAALLARSAPAAGVRYSSAAAAGAATGRVRPLELYPAEVLRAKCAPLAAADAPEAQPLLLDLLATVASQHGLGLAAPQIGETRRAFVMREPAAWHEREARRMSAALRRQLAAKPAAFVACVNPEILHRSPEMAVGLEGCLSLPDYPCLVRRARSVTVRYTDQHGETVERELSGLPAVVFQHELDHLDGVLIVDREVKTLVRSTYEDAMAEAQEAFELGLAKYYCERGQPQQA